MINLFLKGKLMITRGNKILEKVIKGGVKLARNKKFQLARTEMTKAGVSYLIIDRILFEPYNIRHTD